MTVRELIQLNQMITDAEITIRDNGIALIDQLNIGPSEGVKPPYPFRVPRKLEYVKAAQNRMDDKFYKDALYMDRSINSWDDGKDYWQIKVNRIPQKWLDLEVVSWEVWPASSVGVYRRTDGTGKFRNVNFHGQRINIVALPSGQVMDIPDNVDNKDKRDNADNEIEGQMSIEDWMEV